ncbi:MAG: CoA-binding protein [Candidatus Micrarchaeota archaeon]|nr:CoA-binding protein [Candidatus Micrarchaeota archaeon]MDE1834399.1 CoA-binding protein [Candidatus Micrarchaeota archaeon]MDE1859065.1 CoA-binding protein [Candidatus Micrarchaeota archaeon]
MRKMNLKPMMNPHSVAIIGASRNPDKVGHVILQNYINAGYSGKLYAVNKEADEIMGVKAYKSVLDIKENIDLAVIAIPAEFVPQAMEECGKAKVKSLVVVSGGFAEIGNNDLQDKLVSVANKYNMPTLGPNCLGIMDPKSREDTLFLPTFKLSRPQVGGVSFVCQSGAVGSTVLDLIAGEGFGLSKFISYGNAAHVDEVDILSYLMDDPDTKAIIMYVEGIKRGKEFVELARKITKKKPVIILKAGRTAAGMAAARSHTAALAGNYEEHEAIFRQFGFTVAEDLSELLYYAKILSTESFPSGGRTAIITNGGGVGVITADAMASTKHLTLADFTQKTKTALRKVMPPLVNITNPLDLAGDAGEERYGAALSLLSADPNVDMILVIALFQTPGADSRVAAKLISAKEQLDKPLIALSIGADYTKMHRIMMESAGLPVYDSPSSAVKSLDALLKYAKYRNGK